MINSNNNYAIISITDRNGTFPQLSIGDNLSKMLRVRFDDVLNDEENCITEHDAVQIKQFIELVNSDKITKELFINCDGGVSRSAAVAAATLKYLDLDDSVIWNNGRYSPNRFVYETLAKEFNLDTKDLDSKESINIQAWKELNDIE